MPIMYSEPGISYFLTGNQNVVPEGKAKLNHEDGPGVRFIVLSRRPPNEAWLHG